MVSISVIIPNYNHRPFLKQRIDSVLNQTFTDIEVILLDDASNDGSDDIISSYRNHTKVSQIVFNKKNSGSPFKQWLKGISMAKGRYIWIAESDDYVSPQFLETLVPLLTEHIGIVYSQSQDINEHGNYLKNRIEYTSDFKKNIWQNDFVIKGTELIRDYMLVKNVIPNASAVIFDKKLMPTPDLINPLKNMRMCGDWLFWIQLCKNTNVAFKAETLNYFRSHEGISRKHNNLLNKKHRIKEEILLRSIIKNDGYEDKSKDAELLDNWFSMHAMKDVFNTKFYSIAYRKPKVRLSFKFIYYKIKKVIS